MGKNFITLTTPLLRTKKRNYYKHVLEEGDSNFTMTSDEISELVTFLQNRQRCLPYTKAFHNATCITDVSWTISSSTNEVITVFTTNTLVISKTTLINVAFGSSFCELFPRKGEYGIVIASLLSKTINVELPYLTWSTKWYGNTFHLRLFLEKELDMRILIDQVGDKLYIGVNGEAIQKMNDIGCLSFENLIDKYYIS
jgi:hypothetical protein